MNPLGAAAALAIPLTVSLAEAQLPPVGTPDGRASVAVSGSQSGSGGSLGASGNIGAFGFDTGIEGVFAGDQSYLRILNPPLNGAFTFSREKFERDGTPQEYDESFGQPIAHATIGSGGITEGVDEAGRLTVLGWPGPGMYDHVNFIHVTRGASNGGAPENGGSFGGVGAEWLTPSFGWTEVSQEYASELAETLVTKLGKGSLEVTITDVVDPVEDLIARNFRFDCLPDTGCVPPATLAYYANMNPTTSRLPRAPSVTDGALDNFSDFGTVYDEHRSVMLHFRPYKIDPAAPTMLATGQPSLDNAERAAEGAFGTGVYLAVGGQSPAAEFQAGLDSFGLVRSEAEGTPLLDPYHDLTDGELSGSPAAFGKTAGALAGLAADADGSFTVYIGAADTAQGAEAIIERARDRGFAAIRSESEADWLQWISRARLPATADAETLRVARHALMLIRTAQDRATGAIVANATVQTPYRQDWVRDGSFFNYALLLAGYPEMAIRHSDFYRRVYRPGGTWDSLYYPDGAEAGLVYPYEIDSQAFALWALWLPFEFDPSRLDYLAEVYPAIRDTANALLLCRDPTNGLQCYAAEDDAIIPTQGAQGASTVYLALRKATAAAAARGVDADLRELWTARAEEIRAAALQKLCVGAGCPVGRGGVYLVWPSRLLAGEPSEQPLLDRFAAELDARSNPDQNSRTPGIGGYIQYPMEPILALAPFW
ncbi:MAG: hypothetical protein ACREQQ_04610, partial [Candidatus Binatia bacterium]